MFKVCNDPIATLKKFKEIKDKATNLIQNSDYYETYSEYHTMIDNQLGKLEAEIINNDFTDYVKNMKLWDTIGHNQNVILKVEKLQREEE